MLYAEKLQKIWSFLEDSIKWKAEGRRRKTEGGKGGFMMGFVPKVKIENPATIGMPIEYHRNDGIYLQDYYLINIQKDYERGVDNLYKLSIRKTDKYEYEDKLERRQIQGSRFLKLDWNMATNLDKRVLEQFYIRAFLPKGKKLYQELLNSRVTKFHLLELLDPESVDNKIKHRFSATLQRSILYLYSNGNKM